MSVEVTMTNNLSKLLEKQTKEAKKIKRNCTYFGKAF